MTTKEITLCGQQVKVIYCAASENGFEDLSGKKAVDFDHTSNKDMLNLAIACIIAAYAMDEQNAPIESKDLLYKATSDEIINLYRTVLELKAAWYNIPVAVAEDLKKESEQMTDEERAEASKNAQAPTTDTVGS